MRALPFRPDGGFKPDSGVASGLIGRYLFEGRSVLDSSGNQNSGTLFQVTSFNLSFGNSPVGPCLNFPLNTTAAPGSGVTLPTAMNISKFTYSAWVNPVAIGNLAQVMGCASHTGFAGPAMDIVSGHVRLTKDNVSLIGQSSGTPVVAGVWQHIAVSYDGTNYAIYYNGVLVASGANAQTFTFSGQIIGACANPSFNFNGSIADFQIYNRVVSPAEMMRIYQGAVGPNDFGSIVSSADMAIPGIAGEINATGNSQTLDDVTQSATAALIIGASSAQTLGNVTQAATASVPDGAAGTEALGDVTQTATAALAVNSSGSATLDNFTQAATGSLTVSADGAQTLDDITQSAEATVAGSSISASGDQTLDDTTQSATASVPVSASGSAALDNVTQLGSVTVPDGAQGTEPLDNVVQLAAAESVVNASGAVTLDGVSQSAAATVIIGSVGVQALGDVVQVATAKILILKRVIELVGTVSRSVNLGGAITRSIPASGSISRVLSVSGSIPRRENQG